MALKPSKFNRTFSSESDCQSYVRAQETFELVNSALGNTLNDIEI